jgi:predicted amidophosphoribosyltransferase
MGEALQCPQCGRQVSRKKNRCLFCGIEAESDRVFDV